MAFLLVCGTPFDVVETKIIKPSKCKVDRIIKHQLGRKPTMKPAVSNAQLSACIAKLDGGFEREIQSMCV